MIVLSAAVSSLAVLFTWGFSRRSWDGQVAKYAAWGVMLYPEAVLLGSSQTREAFVIPLAAMAFYGLARLRRERTWVSLAWLLAGVLLSLLFSPLYAVVLVAALLITAIAIKDELLGQHLKASRWTWLIMLGVIYSCCWRLAGAEKICSRLLHQPDCCRSILDSQISRFASLL